MKQVLWFWCLQTQQLPTGMHWGAWHRLHLHHPWHQAVAAATSSGALLQWGEWWRWSSEQRAHPALHDAHHTLCHQHVSTFVTSLCGEVTSLCVVCRAHAALHGSQHALCHQHVSTFSSVWWWGHQFVCRVMPRWCHQFSRVVFFSFFFFSRYCFISG